MLNGFSKSDFEQSVKEISVKLCGAERRRLFTAIANLISAGWKATGSYEGAILKLHGMTAEEIILQGEKIDLGTPRVVGEKDGVSFVLYKSSKELGEEGERR